MSIDIKKLVKDYQVDVALPLEKFLYIYGREYFFIFSGIAEPGQLRRAFSTVSLETKDFKKENSIDEFDLVYRVNFPELRTKVKIGRGGDCEVRTPDLCMDISKCHAMLKKGKSVYIIDAASTCGTFINGQKLPKYEEKPLSDGTVICLASSGKLTFYEPPTFYQTLSDFFKTKQPIV